MSNFISVNPNASDEVVNVLNYFKSICGKGILSGQHDGSISGSQFDDIKKITGKYPAVLGFDFLSYTKNSVKYADEAAEIKNNIGCVETALKLAKEKNVLITFCWHWCAPKDDLMSHAFYSNRTEFDFAKEWLENGEGRQLLIDDMDDIAEQLKRFRDAGIPVLWRPLHESYGDWFWWGKGGSKACKDLFRFMYDRFTNYHKLNNLIWIYSGYSPEYYPGDDIIDINGMDSYTFTMNSGALIKDYVDLKAITDKPCAVTEVGAIIDPDEMISKKTDWLWFSLWSGFQNKPDQNTHENIARVYNHPYTINSEDLPELY